MRYGFRMGSNQADCWALALRLRLRIRWVRTWCAVWSSIWTRFKSPYRSPFNAPEFPIGNRHAGRSPSGEWLACHCPPHAHTDLVAALHGLDKLSSPRADLLPPRRDHHICAVRPHPEFRPGSGCSTAPSRTFILQSVRQGSVDKKSWRKLLSNPVKAIPYLILPLTLLALGAVVAFQSANPGANLSLPQSILIALLSGLIGAALALWIQSHVSRESQNRRFKQELEVRYFEEIYGPLYEDAMRVAAGLLNCEDVKLAVWDQLLKSKYLPFVERTIARDASALGGELVHLGTLRKAAQQVIVQQLHELNKDYPPYTVPQPVPVGAIVMVLDLNLASIVYPETGSFSPVMVRGLAEVLSRNSRVSKEGATRYLKRLKGMLEHDPAVMEYAHECTTAANHAMALTEVIRIRMSSPFSEGT